MKQSLPIVLVLLLCMLHYKSNAQYGHDYDGPLFSRPKALAVVAGTQGFGLDYTQSISNSVGVRIGGAYLPFTYRYSGDFGTVSSDVKVKTQSFVNAHLMVDWYPFDELGFRITPGVGYFFKAKSIATVTPTGTYKYGDINVTADEIGNFTGTLEWKGFSPYLGAGWLFAFSGGESPLSLAVDLGTYYLSKPDATLIGTKLLENNSYNEERFQENVKNYRWLPVLQVSLRYSF